MATVRKGRFNTREGGYCAEDYFGNPLGRLDADGHPIGWLSRKEADRILQRSKDMDRYFTALTKEREQCEKKERQ